MDDQSPNLFGRQTHDPPFAIYVEGDENPVAHEVRTANTFWSRFLGFQFRVPPDLGEGLLLFPAASIHTFWMRGPIDIVWLNRSGQVLRVCQAVRPWRLRSAPKGSFAVLELGVGTSDRLNTGDQLVTESKHEIR